MRKALVRNISGVAVLRSALHVAEELCRGPPVIDIRGVGSWTATFIDCAEAHPHSLEDLHRLPADETVLDAINLCKRSVAKGAFHLVRDSDNLTVCEQAHGFDLADGGDYFGFSGKHKYAHRAGALSVSEVGSRISDRCKNGRGSSVGERSSFNRHEAGGREGGTAGAFSERAAPGHSPAPWSGARLKSDFVGLEGDAGGGQYQE